MSSLQTSPSVNEERSQRQFSEVADIRKAFAAELKSSSSAQMSPEVLARLEKIASKNA